MLPKYIYPLVLVMLTAFTLRAQDASVLPLEPGTYKYHSYKQLAHLQKKLTLDVEQNKKLEKVLLDYYHDLSALPPSKDSLAIRGQRIQVLQNSLMNDFKQILTLGQFELYRQELENTKRRRKTAKKPE